VLILRQFFASTVFGGTFIELDRTARVKTRKFGCLSLALDRRDKLLTTRQRVQNVDYNPKVFSHLFNPLFHSQGEGSTLLNRQKHVFVVSHPYIKRGSVASLTAYI